ncbi:MAG: glycosyltransferase family 2 protein [Pseudomonadota bacterium]
MTTLSLISPCYNESDNIRDFVEDWHRELAARIDDFEIIIVDDCSTDATPDLLKALQAKYPRLEVLTNATNRRYGAAVMRGLRHAAGQYVIWTDSDYSHRPSDFWKLWRRREAFDGVWGIRRVDQRDSLGRIFFTIGNILLIGLIFNIRLKDPNCAFKLFRRDALMPVIDAIRVHPIMTTTKIAIRARQAGLSIEEVPVEFLERTRGQGSIDGVRQIGAAVEGVRELMAFRLRGR